MTTYHLSQFNIATGVGLSDEPAMSGFMQRLDEINGVADDSPGFVWRLQASDGNATSIVAYSNEKILINLSVWETIKDFRQFVYTTAHRDMVNSGRNWFEPKTQAQIVMWWTPAGQLPTVEEGVRRLDLLRANGASAEAFPFRSPFPAPH